MLDSNELDKWRQYYKCVHHDFNGLINSYPYSELRIPPTVSPSLAEIFVVAVTKSFIEKSGSCKEDFLNCFSRQLYISVPIDYRCSGCNVYGGKWLDSNLLSDSDIHFYFNNKMIVDSFGGFKMCVGTPESFVEMTNVILENVKTAENMLIAYERKMRGDSKSLEMIAYSHGDAVRKEYIINKKRYNPSKNDKK